MDSLLMSLIEKEIPDGRNALADSHKNLAVLSDYCKENYYNSPDKEKALNETKAYASQSLASVAYQIHSLAVNILQMMDQQTIQLQKMQSNANNIGLVVEIHKEKVARREIGVLTSSKNFSRSHKIVAPPQQEKTQRYKREDIDYTCLDHIGHGVKTNRRNDSQRRVSTSSSSGSVKGTSVSSVHSSSQGSLQNSIYQSVNTPPSDRKRQFGSSSSMPPAPRPPIAPVAPFKPKAPLAPAPAPPQHVPAAPPPPSNIAPPPMFVPERDYDNDDDALLPPPPPDMDGLYQIPTSNMLAEDLPPPPPDNFYDPSSPTTPMPPPPPPPAELLVADDAPENYEEKVIAIYSYQKLRDDELELTEGDLIYVVKKNDDGWFEGIKNGVQGLFPGNYVTAYM